MPSGVKQLILINGGVYLFQLVLPGITATLGLYPPAVLSVEVWRLFTYMFLHGNLFHLLINMFMLYMFGSRLEQAWGRRRFVRYYLLCGVGAGLFALLPIPAFFNAIHIGAAGVFGLLLAFGLLFRSAQVHLLGILPMSARHVVILFGLIALLNSFSPTSVGGLVVGYMLLRRDGLISRRPPARGCSGAISSAKGSEPGSSATTKTTGAGDRGVGRRSSDARERRLRDPGPAV